MNRMKRVLPLAFVVPIAAAGAVGLRAFLNTSRGLESDLQHRIDNRAQLLLLDDFQKGLDSWEARHPIARTWTYDGNGFVIPGELALFKPSMQLTDYDVETRAEIANKGFGLAFRAAGLENYYALKFTTQGSGAAASLAGERYTVTDGKVSARQPIHGPIPVWKNQVCRLRLQARGDSFALYVDEHLVDHWSDRQLKSGGIGLFCEPGQSARVVRIQVSHQTDLTGKVCALLSWISTAVSQEYQ